MKVTHTRVERRRKDGKPPLCHNGEGEREGGRGGEENCLAESVGLPKIRQCLGMQTADLRAKNSCTKTQTWPNLEISTSFGCLEASSHN